ncbi:DUF5009 domain-containing protein [Olivibacter sitiensis]|uniref:DUF5009 domain-containing protein n=1 Tax=Olivibacter sitiensis TaxID=376470 RepID=UPI000482EF7A|nr:DUF5009 domain-containing protein [Olivibacter sitiensis]
MKTKQPRRIQSIDIMRGLTLFLMLFVNDIYVPGVPGWIGHTKADVDGMGLADWVFPGFLFMVGMSIPYALHSRIKQGQSNLKILAHIFSRTISLLLIGVLMVNIDRLDEQLTGMNRNLWAILMYIAIFLIWNQYPKSMRWNWLFKVLKALGLVGLCALALLFRSGEPENTWMTTSWWGILGLIGWGYFVAAIAGLCVGEKPLAALGLWLIFVVVNILSQLGMLNELQFLNPVFGVIIDGHVPSVVLAGLTVSLILRKAPEPTIRTALRVAISGLICLVMGLVLRHWFIISKIYGTPSWTMICNGISLLLYASLYIIVDYLGKSKWANLFQAAGKNSLTTYLAPDIIYFTCWGLGIPLFFYKQAASPLLAIGGSLGWAFAMIWLAIWLSKINIRLKL